MEEGTGTVVTAITLPVNDYSAVVTFLVIALMFAVVMAGIETFSPPKKKKPKWPPHSKDM